jgi:hypothetical protein
MMRTLAKMFRHVPASDAITRQLVYRTIPANAVQDPWERRIIELGEGRSIGEITEILYWEEVRRGAWAVDIGLWKHLFDQCVVNTIRELASRGHICLMPGDISYGESEVVETRNRSGKAYGHEKRKVSVEA